MSRKTRLLQVLGIFLLGIIPNLQMQETKADPCWVGQVNMIGNGQCHRMHLPNGEPPNTFTYDSCRARAEKDFGPPIVDGKLKWELFFGGNDQDSAAHPQLGITCQRWALDWTNGQKPGDVQGVYNDRNELTLHGLQNTLEGKCNNQIDQIRDFQPRVGCNCEGLNACMTAAVLGGGLASGLIENIKASIKNGTITPSFKFILGVDEARRMAVMGYVWCLGGAMSDCTNMDWTEGTRRCSLRHCNQEAAAAVQAVKELGGPVAALSTFNDAFKPLE